MRSFSTYKVEHLGEVTDIVIMLGTLCIAKVLEGRSILYPITLTVEEFEVFIGLVKECQEKLKKIYFKDIKVGGAFVFDGEQFRKIPYFDGFNVVGVVKDKTFLVHFNENCRVERVP